MFFLKGKKIVIYGYNSLFHRNEQILKHIKEANLELYGFIDKNANQLPIKSLTYDNFKLGEYQNKQDYVFILNFWDANIHVEIADQLYMDGFRNIVFLPFDERYEYLKAHIIRQFYNQVLYGKIRGEEVVPSYDELLDNKKLEIIKDYNEYISFWLSIGELYTNNISESQDMDKRYKISVYSEVPVTELKYYMELYDYIFDKGKYPTCYVINMRKGRNPEKFLNNRRQLFQKMEYKIKYDWNYFIDSPILVEYSHEKHIFTILDGLHRTIFLIKHGYEKVPVICNKNNIVQYLGGYDYD